MARLRDITELQRAEDASRHAAKLALVASRTDNAVIITDVHGRIEWANEGFTRISGYTLDEVSGRSRVDPPGAGHRPGNRGLHPVATGQGRRVPGRDHQLRQEGRPYWLAIEVQPVRDARGRLIQFMAIESDVTERKRTRRHWRSEAKAREDEAKSRPVKSGRREKTPRPPPRPPTAPRASSWPT